MHMVTTQAIDTPIGFHNVLHFLAIYHLASIAMSSRAGISIASYILLYYT